MNIIVLEIYFLCQMLSSNWLLLTPSNYPPPSTTVSFMARVRNNSNKTVGVSLIANDRESARKSIPPYGTGFTSVTYPIKLSKLNYIWTLLLKTYREKTLIAGVYIPVPHEILEVDTQLYSNYWWNTSWTNSYSLKYIANEYLPKLRIAYELRANMPLPMVAFGKLYRKGIPGTERQAKGTKWTTFIENFTSIQVRDTIELYGKHNTWTEAGNYAESKNFRAIFGEYMLR